MNIDYTEYVDAFDTCVNKIVASGQCKYNFNENKSTPKYFGEHYKKKHKKK